MSRFDPLFLSVLEAIAASEALGDTFMNQPAGWMGWDLPPPADQEDGYPCVRIQLLDSRNTKQGQYSFNISLWLRTDNSDASKDKFFDLADELEARLNERKDIICRGYIERSEPQNGLNRAIFPITYIAGLRPTT